MSQPTATIDQAYIQERYPVDPADKLLQKHSNYQRLADISTFLTRAEKDDKQTQEKTWEARQASLRQIRLLIEQGQLTNDPQKPADKDFWRQAKIFLSYHVADARSTVQTEACVTVAYISEKFPPPIPGRGLSRARVPQPLRRPQKQ